MKRLISLTAFLVLAASLAVGTSFLAKDQETRWAYVENQTDEDMRLTYEDTEAGMKAKHQVPLYAGQVKKLNTKSLNGEVCVWRAQEFAPAEKVGCRTLQPGEHWVIH